MPSFDHLVNESQDSEAAHNSREPSRERAAAESQEAAEYASRGEARRAEDAFRRSIKTYQRVGDTNGAGYVLLRLGKFYQDTDQADKAVTVYREALDLGAGVQGIYVALMHMLAERGQGDELFRIAQEYYRCFERCREDVLRILIRLAKDLAPDDATAEAWLLRAEGWAAEVGDTSARFAAWGLRSRIYERRGNLDRAVQSYEEAVAAGSSDRLTFTRLLMAYEKARRWDDLLRVAERGLAVQRDAAWEEDLRNRLQRARLESGAIPRGERATIPAFSVRQGQANVHLLAQIESSPPCRNLAVSMRGDRVFVAGASSRVGNLALYDLKTRTVVWRATVRGSADVFASEDERYVAITQQGRVGDGSAEVSVVDEAGRSKASVSVPDKLSEVRLAGDQLVVGCRNGFLYSYDLEGRLRWCYRVRPRAGIDVRAPYWRPFPYPVAVSPEGERILFCSWDEVSMLDNVGNLLWTWRADIAGRTFRNDVDLDEETLPPTEVGQLSGISITFKIEARPQVIYGLATGPRGERSAVVSSSGHLAILDDHGGLLHTLATNGGPGWLAASRDLSRIVHAHWKGLNFYSPTGLLNVFPAEQLFELKAHEGGERVAAWRSRTLLVLDGTGHLIAEIEFARDIGGVAYLDEHQLLVAAGELVQLAIS